MPGQAVKVIQHEVEAETSNCGCEVVPAGKVTLAGAGTYAKIHKFFDWISRGADPDEYVEDEGERSELIMFNNGTLYSYEGYCEPIELDVPMAVGSGSTFAMGAMLAGATPEEAVHIAMKLDPYTGGEVLVYEL